MHFRWRGLSTQTKQYVWRMYGWFTALMCCGSLVGAATWVCYMQSNALYFTFFHSVRCTSSCPSMSQKYAVLALSNRWQAAFSALYPLEFMCLSVAKLLLLHRVLDLTPNSLEVRRRVALAGRIVLGVVVTCNVVGLCGDWASTAYSAQAAAWFDAAAAASAANHSAAALAFVSKGDFANDYSNVASSVQAFAEAGVLLLIVAAFLTCGAIFAYCVKFVLRDLQQAAAGDVEASARVDEFSDMRTGSESRRLASATAAKGRYLRLQVLATVAVVFTTFLLRTTWAVMNALSSLLQNMDAPCGAGDTWCDGTCRNVYALVFNWLNFTPEFAAAVVLLSSPLALLVALWGMTSKRMLELMNAGKHNQEAAFSLRP